MQQNGRVGFPGGLCQLHERQPPQRPQTQQKRNQLRQHGCERSSENAPAKAHHEQQVERNISKARRDNRKQRCSAVAQTAQHGRRHIVRNDDERAAELHI